MSSFHCKINWNASIRNGINFTWNKREKKNYKVKSVNGKISMKKKELSSHFINFLKSIEVKKEANYKLQKSL